MSLYAIIKSLQETQGNNAKLEILQANKDNDLLKAYMKAVFDPAVNYWQTKMPKIDPGFTGDREFELIDILFMVDRLAGRVLTGNDAKSALAGHASALNAEGRELMGHIIKRKIDKSNVGETMVLKTWPGLFFIPPYMRCSSMSEKVVEHYRKLGHFYVQPKRDGSFAYGVNDEGKYGLCTRQSNYYPEWFADLVLHGLPGNAVLIGELEVYENLPCSSAYMLLDRKTGNGILTSIERGADSSEFTNYRFRYVAWDYLWLDEWKSGKSDRQYFDRLEELAGLLNHSHLSCVELIETHEVSSVEEAFRINTRLTAAGKEGSVWKTISGKWRDTDSGTKDMVKLKVKFQADYDVIGYYEGEGKAAGMLGGITVASKCRKLISNCGTGFSDEARINFFKMFNEHGTDGLIAEIEANDVIDSKDRPDVLALSLPVFMELRRDKKDADTLERVIEQRDAARLGK
jgi:ATP-dependent DNA ligase